MSWMNSTLALPFCPQNPNYPLGSYASPNPPGVIPTNPIDYPTQMDMGPKIKQRIQKIVESTKIVFEDFNAKLTPEAAETLKLALEAKLDKINRLRSKDKKGTYLSQLDELSLTLRNRKETLQDMKRNKKFEQINFFLAEDLKKHPIVDQLHLQEEQLGSVEMLTNLITKQGGSSALYWMRAKTYIAEKNFREAIKDLLLVISFEPKNSKALLAAGFCHYELKQMRQAFNYLSNGIALDPHCEVSMYYWKGEAARQLADSETAEADYAVVLEKNPHYFDDKIIIFHLATIKFSLKKYGEANLLFSRLKTSVKDTDPELTAAIYGFEAIIAARQNRFFEAQKILIDMSMLAAKSPRVMPTYHFIKGIMHLDQVPPDLEKAKKDFIFSQIPGNDDVITAYEIWDWSLLYNFPEIGEWYFNDRSISSGKTLDRLYASLFGFLKNAPSQNLRQLYKAVLRDLPPTKSRQDNSWPLAFYSSVDHLLKGDLQSSIGEFREVIKTHSIKTPLPLRTFLVDIFEVIESNLHNPAILAACLEEKVDLHIESSLKPSNELENVAIGIGYLFSKNPEKGVPFFKKAAKINSYYMTLADLMTHLVNGDTEKSAKIFSWATIKTIVPDILSLSNSHPRDTLAALMFISGVCAILFNSASPHTPAQQTILSLAQERFGFVLKQPSPVDVTQPFPNEIALAGIFVLAVAVLGTATYCASKVGTQTPVPSLDPPVNEADAIKHIREVLVELFKDSPLTVSHVQKSEKIFQATLNSSDPNHWKILREPQMLSAYTKVISELLGRVTSESREDIPLNVRSWTLKFEKAPTKKQVRPDVLRTHRESIQALDRKIEDELVIQHFRNILGNLFNDKTSLVGLFVSGVIKTDRQFKVFIECSNAVLWQILRKKETLDEYMKIVSRHFGDDFKFEATSIDDPRRWELTFKLVTSKQCDIKNEISKDILNDIKKCDEKVNRAGASLRKPK